MERRKPETGEVYKHFKGNLYKIVTIAEDTETGKEVVVYQALYGEYKIYVRDLEMFMSLVDKEKYPNVKQEFRFKLTHSPTVLDIKDFQADSKCVTSTDYSFEVGLKEGLEAGYNQGFADATKKNKDEVCEWQWNEDSRNNEIFALVKCKGLSYGDRIIFNSIRLFTYCPYCSKKIFTKV